VTARPGPKAFSGEVETGSPQKMRPNQTIPAFGDRRKRRIGLLGGSFNPAHDGHLHISQAALKHLGLDQVWWMVSPQNPLKPVHGMAPLAKRLESARKRASGSNIIVTDIERRLGTVRTLSGVRSLKRRFPGITFVWLMGADNLAQAARWWRWPEIFHAVRVAVFDRNAYSYGALAGTAARRFGKVRTRRPSTIWHRLPPVWTYVAIRRHPASATALRNAK
jgi:nicotinate-nucleotide adenylyltransferase